MMFVREITFAIGCLFAVSACSSNPVPPLESAYAPASVADSPLQIPAEEPSAGPRAEDQKPAANKLAEFASDVPCLCVFNKNRSWNPEQITYKGKVWGCKHYDSNGTCSSLRVIRDAGGTDMKPENRGAANAIPGASMQESGLPFKETAADVPTTGVFNKNRLWNPERIRFKHVYWRCREYAADGTCKQVMRDPNQNETQSQ
ncbi:hypothetical protein [uncultured Cohaesibacter sp.]|uniref:hypothetical protein n=1 Tax=uncultured Cohaesibacter sp. TaxID=1002546 RepID=UPI0029C7C593|nr:hypothetical protein [uncultured Cohaesibacter sp.]